MLKKLIAPVVVSGALLGSLAVGGAASAGAATTAATATAAAGHHHHGNGKLHAWLKANRAAIRAQGLAVSAQAIGITPLQLATELKAGASIAQVAAAHGVSAATVVAALTTAADAKVAAAVTAGTLTPTQGARITAVLPARITKIVNHVF